MHGRPLRTTLDGGVQVAAEEALGDSEDVTALVAVDPDSGDVLAAASRPVDDAFNRAFEGQYPPGSTFKVIVTTALLAGGLDPEQTVDCPPTIVAGGREFRNFEGEAADAVPFRTDFAQSCNTAFISLADRLEPGDFPATAELFGLGRDYELGVPTFSGEVPAPADEVEQAASMIGQGRILVSPVAMAAVAAAARTGRWHQPRVLAGDPHATAPALPAQAAELRSLMRDVVTQGTGTALASLPGEPIGKSGTAEYGSGDPPPTHAWFIAARDDIAVAVLVEDKPSGGEFAAPIVADFLRGVPPGSIAP
jgi:cell division protein FtsI/penicillin-binding protein 2